MLDVFEIGIDLPRRLVGIVNPDLVLTGIATSDNLLASRIEVLRFQPGIGLGNLI